MRTPGSCKIQLSLELGFLGQDVHLGALDTQHGFADPVLPARQPSTCKHHISTAYPSFVSQVTSHLLSLLERQPISLQPAAGLCNLPASNPNSCLYLQAWALCVGVPQEVRLVLRPFVLDRERRVAGNTLLPAWARRVQMPTSLLWVQAEIQLCLEQE